MFLKIVEDMAFSAKSISDRHSIIHEALTGFDPDEIETEYNIELTNFANGLYGKRFYSVYHCHIPSNNAYLMANGDVFPCLRAIGHYDIQPLGNIYHQAIDIIRSSPAWRKYASNAGKHSVCRTCKNLFEFNIKEGPQHDI